MARKFIVAAVMILSLVITSCYPELSVQQYDQLRKDLAELDNQRQELTDTVNTLQEQVTDLQTQLADLKAKNKQTLSYIQFLDRLVATQSSGNILNGEFDAESLVDANNSLIEAARLLPDSDVEYYLGLMTVDNEGQTMGAYYKIIEHTVKKIKKNLE